MALAVVEAFEGAKREYLSSAKKRSHDVSHFASIKEVYDVTDKIQRDQSKSGTLRNLRRIEPYLDSLRHYAEVIETFVSVKPDVLALIWGPVKAILLATKTYIGGYEKIWDTMTQVGVYLPQFEKYTEIFHHDEHMKRFLSLFYKDILDFHSCLLDFFELNKTRMFFEAIWPKYSGKIQVIVENIAKHKNLMDSQVTLANIVEAEAARAESYRVFQQMQDFQAHTEFEQAKIAVSARMYDDEVERAWRSLVTADQTSSWLEGLVQFQSWADPADPTSTLLWLRGIPGAGKTVIAASVAKRLAREGRPLAFAFLSYQDQQNSSALKTLHTFIFQLAIENKDLKPAICLAYRENSRQLLSSVNFTTNLLKEILETLPTTYFILDGIDEILEAERRLLLDQLLSIQEERKSLKILVSCRPEQDILRLLAPKVDPINIEDGNNEAIKNYIRRRASAWLSELDIDSHDKTDITLQMSAIATSARGMFLYAKLVCDSIELQRDVEAAKSEINNLPDGLGEAYGRILSRIETGLSTQARSEAKQVLELVCCSLRPLTRNEINRALNFVSVTNSPKGKGAILTSIFKCCGPIIEEVDGYIQFVHFSAREFLLHPQSGPFLAETEAHAKICSICINYLLSDLFDEELPESVLEQEILDGSYVLDNYVSLRWFDQVKMSINSKSETVVHTVEKLLEERENDDFSSPSNLIAKPRVGGFLSFPEHIQPTLVNLDFFWKLRQRGFCMTKVETWGNFDPLTISKQQSRIRRKFEQLLCLDDNHTANCGCTRLLDLYGPNVYKCSRPGCAKFRYGFNNRAERDRHIQAHERPFKCDFVDCVYYDLGYTSSEQLKKHMDAFHTIVAGASALPSDEDFGQLAEAKFIIKDAIDIDDMGLVRDMYKAVRRHGTYFIKHCLITGSTSEMLQLLLKICDNKQLDLRWSWFLDWPEVAVKDEAQLFRILMEQGAVKVGTFDDIASSVSPEMFELFEEYGAEARNMKKLFRKLIPTRANAQTELKALQCIQAMGGLLDLKSYEICLKVLSERCLSISIAKFCLENGASGHLSWGTSSALEHAKTRNLPEAIEFVEFLQLNQVAAVDKRK